jgi:hypothetical protein
MAMSLENILCEMGVEKDSIIYINYKDLMAYDDYLILLINMHCMQDTGNKILFGTSPRIIPVFLSISINDTDISEEQAQKLRTYAPIGCRDDRTMHAMRNKNIDAFVMGCLTATFDKREILQTQTKVFFASVPYGVFKYIPDEIKENIEFIEHEFDTGNLPEGMTTIEYTKMIMERYKKEARLVVTSRFHGAMLSLAYGIPVILVNETFTFRFSTLCNLIPYYTRETFSQIDWNPIATDIESVKVRMKKIAKMRITEAKNKYKDICEQSALLEYSGWENEGLIDYYDEAIEHIEKNWKKEEEINYAIWGFNNNAKAIIEYIKINFPKAKMAEIYDTFKEISFEGILSVKPDKIDSGKGLFIFVTTFVAGYFAKQVFEEKGISCKKYFICKRRYVEKEDLL